MTTILEGNMTLEPMTLVRPKPELVDEYKGIFFKYDLFIFLGEIKNMPGHGVFLLHYNGSKMSMGARRDIIGTSLSGYHIDSFEEVD